MAKANIKVIKEFFAMGMAEFKREWVEGGLTDKDKEEIAEGIGNGTLTY